MHHRASTTNATSVVWVDGGYKGPAVRKLGITEGNFGKAAKGKARRRKTWEEAWEGLERPGHAEAKRGLDSIGLT